MTMLTIKQAAQTLGISEWAIRDLVEEAFSDPKKSRWKHGKHFLDLSVTTSKRRLIRIHPHALGIQDLIDRNKFSEYKEKDPVKMAARAKVSSRVRGTKEWPPAKVFKCSTCEAQAFEYHHEDYSRWWDVVPLCRSCHRKRHNEMS